ncbi:LOB domain-containing protein 15 [Physcomitrium patens]|uniref:LOB domain-containing protein n=1 Tax=Physcomitrium patens TaxID=3218 RepID=A0A2K1IJC4_PHYPA|nr:LOB domain-containing protein 15-like [Physcomitrium patens]PNR29381.1 hypothetical protein PHYPA_028074 [Physcomitrium patens]|eukprot:XP_024362454.1 LOB domain-containing protein 15-like [Physcomitrella patens]
MLSSQGQGSTPCAACKLLRRRCAQECPFSPYFSPHEPQKFACVHKIFGASNVSKMLMEVPENQRADAASSLVYEANARIRDPVYGCMGAISALQQQAQALQAELSAVRQEITRYRQHDSSPTDSAPATTTTSASALVSGYQKQVRERGSTSDTQSSKPSTSEVYTTVQSPSSTVATSESNDAPYWSSIS